LNFGDCVAYAPAKQSGEPLLLKTLISPTRTSFRVWRDDYAHQPALVSRRIGGAGTEMHSDSNAANRFD